MLRRTRARLTADHAGEHGLRLQTLEVPTVEFSEQLGLFHRIAMPMRIYVLELT